MDDVDEGSSLVGPMLEEAGEGIHAAAHDRVGLVFVARADGGHLLVYPLSLQLLLLLPLKPPRLVQLCVHMFN